MIQQPYIEREMDLESEYEKKFIVESSWGYIVICYTIILTLQYVWKFYNKKLEMSKN